MKKRLWILMLLASLCLAMRSGNVLSLSSVSGQPGEEVTVSVTFTNTDAVTALEMNIALPEAMNYVNGSCILNSVRVPRHRLNAVQTNGMLKIYLYSLTQENIGGTSGELLTFKLRLSMKPHVYRLVPSLIVSDAEGKKLTASVNGGTVTLLAPELAIDRLGISYGQVPIHTSHTAQLHLRNSGNRPLTVSNIRADAGSLKASETAFVLAGGESRLVTLTYSPVVRGTFTTALHIESDAVNGGDQQVQIDADPFSVNELHVSSAQGVSDGTVTVKLRMNDMEPIVAVQCSFNLPESLVYVPGSAAVTSRGTDHVVKASSSGGRLTLYAYSLGNSAFVSDDGDVLTFDLKLNGTSGTYDLYPQNVVLSNKGMENMVSAEYGGYVTISSPTLTGTSILNFGNQPMDGSVRAGYQLANTGNAPLVIDRVAFLAEGYQVETRLPLTVPAGERGELVVAYAPQGEGTFATTMHVYSNDPLQRMKPVGVSGVAYETNNLVLSVDTLDDGNALLHVSLNNYSKVVALQFDVQGVISAMLSQDAVKTARLAQHQVMICQMEAGRYRVLVYGSNNETIAGHEGELLALRLMADKVTTTTLTLDSVVIGNGLGVNKVSSSIEGQLVTYGVKYYQLAIGPSANGAVQCRPGKYAAGTAVTLRAVPDEGYKFVAWSNGATANPQVVELTGDTTLTATFAAESYRLRFVIDDEVITEHLVAYGTPVRFITAPPREGYTFDGWTAELNDGDPMPAHDVIVTGAYSINHYTLTITPSAHGRVEGSGASDQYAAGTAVTLRAVPDEGYKFVIWSNGATANPQVVELTSDTTLTATFAAESYRLRFVIDDEVLAEHLVAYGTPVRFITAPPREGYTFNGWTAELNDGDPMPAHDVIVTGAYTEVTTGITQVYASTGRVKVYSLNGLLLLETQDRSAWNRLPRGVYVVNGYKIVKVK